MTRDGSGQGVCVVFGVCVLRLGAFKDLGFGIKAKVAPRV